MSKCIKSVTDGESGLKKNKFVVFFFCRNVEYLNALGSLVDKNTIKAVDAKGKEVRRGTNNNRSVCLMQTHSGTHLIMTILQVHKYFLNI